MQLLRQVWYTLQDFPEYLPGLAAALTILVLGLPLYLGMRYFLLRRDRPFPVRLRFGYLGFFVLATGMAFIFYSPLATKIPAVALNVYLFTACAMAAYVVVPLVDVFLIEYYLINKRKVYISPPLHKIINFTVFALSFLPIMRYALRYNPFAQIALPTIVTAGIALALQDTLKAFFAGIGLGQLVRVGDWITFNDKEGRVFDINWSRTVLRTMQGDKLFIPNTLLPTQPFVNHSAHHFHRFTLKLGVAPSAAPDRVKLAMIQAARDLPDVAEAPAPTAQIVAFDNGVVQYSLYYWVADYAKHYEIQDKLASRIWEAIKAEGFELPFPFPTYLMQEGFHPVPPVRKEPVGNGKKK